jgi:hypothetical protein
MAGVAGVVATVEPTGLGFVLVVAGTPPGQPVRLVRVTPREDAVNARPEPGQAVVVVGHEAGGAIEAVAVGVRRDPRVGSEIVE